MAELETGDTGAVMGVSRHTELGGGVERIGRRGSAGVDTGAEMAGLEAGHVRVGKGSPQPSGAEGYYRLRLKFTLRWLRVPTGAPN